jgi:hypothetical protein
MTQVTSSTHHQGSKGARGPISCPCGSHFGKSEVASQGSPGENAGDNRSCLSQSQGHAGNIDKAVPTVGAQTPGHCVCGSFLHLMPDQLEPVRGKGVHDPPDSSSTLGRLLVVWLIFLEESGVT